MKIGLSLPVSYLAGIEDGPDVYFSVLGEPGHCMDKLKSLGADSIELRGANMNTSSGDIHMAARRAWAAGFETTAHSHLPPAPEEKSFDEIYPELKLFLRELKLAGKSTVLTLHSYVSDFKALPRLFSETVKTLKLLGKSIEDEKLPVKIALELNRQKDKNDPGASYSMLLDMLAAADSDNIGLCWDFGHSYSNALNGFLDRIPPDDFLKKVIHTHVHDLGPQQKTHWPLVQGKIPLSEFVNALEGAGYSGVYNLELSLERFSGEENPAGLIEDSIRILLSAGRR